MKKHDHRSNSAAEIRQKAEALASLRTTRNAEDRATLSPDEIKSTLHELRVHQIELDMQNEELRRARTEIESGRVRYFDLYDRAPVSYCTLSEQGLILEANLMTANLLGTARSALIKQSITRFIVKDDQDSFYLHRKKLVESHSTVSGQASKPHECELRLVKPDGAVFWAHLTTTVAQAEDGAPVCRVVLIDITERKRAEDALQASEMRFKELLLNVPTVAVQGYALDGTVRYWNRASETFYGYAAAEALGQKLLDLIIPPAMRNGVSAAMRRMVETREVIPASEIELMRKDGSLIPVYSAHALVQLPGQEPELFCIDIDLTELKQTEADQKKLQAQYLQAQKMESVGRLAGGVAHDFNNLLMGIMGYTDLCREKVGPDHPIVECLDEITNEAQRSANLTRQLLAFARKQTIEPRLLDLNDAVAGMLKLLRKLIGEDIALAWMPGRDVWPIKADPGQIDQILANLSVNARDAIAGVGHLTIETTNAVIDQACCTENVEAVPGEYAVLTVSDDGCGMDTETLTHIFEPFFTTKAVGQGTGLGLATVYGIARQNWGFVNVQSEPGKGTTFRIYLPRCPIEVEAGAVPQIPATAPGGTETILLVDDENSICVTTALFLQALGYTVLTAADPGEALRLADRHSGPLHLLITDVVMPGMNGQDLAAKLTETYPGMKCLFISGYTADVIAHRGILEEGVHFLAKPFTRDVIARKVYELLKGEQATSKG